MSSCYIAKNLKSISEIEIFFNVFDSILVVKKIVLVINGRQESFIPQEVTCVESRISFIDFMNLNEFRDIMKISGNINSCGSLCIRPSAERRLSIVKNVIDIENSEEEIVEISYLLFDKFLVFERIIDSFGIPMYSLRIDFCDSV